MNDTSVAALLFTTWAVYERSSMNLVCIGTSKRGISSSKEVELHYQKSYPLIAPTTNASSSTVLQNNDVEVPIISTTALALEDFIYSRLTTHDDCNVHTNNKSNGDTNNFLGGNNIDEEEEGYNPVQIFLSDDAHLLHCRPLLSNDDGEEPESTIFGISERMIGHDDSNISIPVDLTLCEPNFKTINSGSSSNQQQKLMHLFKDGCCCHHPKGDWARQDIRSKAQHTNNGSNVQSSSENVNVMIVDLTKMQNLRRRTNVHSDSDETYPCFDTPGRVFHLLRSLLNCNGSIHCASPWSQLYGENQKTCTGQGVVALLVNDSNNKHKHNREVGKVNAVDQFWDDIEEKEINELLNFRTGDAAPSYYLHSSSQLFVESSDILDDITTTLNNEATTATVADADTMDVTEDDGCSLSKDTLLLVYRHLPPRDVLSKRQSSGQDEKYVGCLLETYLEEDVQEEKSELDIGVESETLPPVVKNRTVSPPYISHAKEYPGLLDSLLTGIHVLQEEAQKIPQWTAWPEQNHYADNCWNVFPLCYTFPATDLSQRKFIHKTCSFVPETTKLLQTLGPHLRTALFSRLDPRARLGAHTGWFDLANHVIRVHIPLIVPGGKCSRSKRNISSNNNNSMSNKDVNDDDVNINCNIGLCGTWVDGCVETHEEGRVICFDDSKVHRAFNYSNEERVVLIIDLARPEGLPLGTATGGHSDELDDFINEF